MAIAKNPKRNSSHDADREAEAFISGVGQPPAAADLETKKKPIMVRIDPDLLERIDHAAKRRGLSRSAFIVSSAAEALERMESSYQH
jgi:predicted DNA binding CopG/RHH family protein